MAYRRKETGMKKMTRRQGVLGALLSPAAALVGKAKKPDPPKGPKFAVIRVTRGSTAYPDGFMAHGTNLYEVTSQPPNWIGKSGDMAVLDSDCSMI